MSYHDLHVLHSKKRHDLLLSPIPFWNDSFNDYKWSVPNRKNVSILFMIQLFIEGNREILKGQINLVRASFSFEGGKKFIVLLTLMFNLFILCAQFKSFSSLEFIACLVILIYEVNDRHYDEVFNIYNQSSYHQTT